MARAKKKPPAPSEAFKAHRAARVLADATFTSDTKAADKHGVSAKSIKNWRGRLESDPELAGLYKEALRRLDGRWVDEARQALELAFRTLQAKIPKASLEELLEVVRVTGDVLVQREALVVDDGPADHREGGAAAQDPSGPGQNASRIH